VYSAQGIDWNAVVAHHRQLLARVVEMLFSLVIGLDEGKEVTTVPRSTRDYIYRILRPAESALRRLIMIAARDIEAPTLSPRGRVRTRSPRERRADDPVNRRQGSNGRELLQATGPAPGHFLRLDGQSPAKCLEKAREGAAMPANSTNCKTIPVNLGLAGIGPRPNPAPQKPRQTTAIRPPVFPLIDPLKHFHFGPRRRYGKSIPRITWLDGRDPTPIPEIRLPEPGDPVDATSLCRRLVALKNALENLDREAQRLARWKARRDWSFKALRGEFGPASEAKLKGPNARKLRSSPMRPGYPPGRRKRPRYEIDEILKELHNWAHYSEETNSS